MAKKQKRRQWLITTIIAAIIAAILFAGGMAQNLLANSIGAPPAKYVPFLIGFAAIAFIAAVVAAIIESRQAPAEVDVPGVVKEYEDARDRYLRRVIEGTQYLPLATLDIKAADASTGEQERMRLPDVYIKLDTTAKVDVEEMKGSRSKRGAETMGRDTRPLPALEALIKSTRMVLLGDPGGGKTTFVNHLAFCLASDTLDRRAGWVQRLDSWPKAWDNLLPVSVTLRDLAAWLERNKRPERKTGLFEAYLAWRLRQMGLPDFFDTVHDLLRRGDAILLLDGLDEVPGDTNTCLRVREMLDDLPNAYNSPMVVTCRVFSYQDKRWKLDAQKWPTYELDKLDEEKIDGFITAWYAQLKAMSPMPDADVRAGKLRRAVRQKDLWRLAQNPLLLTVMALVHTRKGELPDARALLYQDAVEILLWRWEGGKIQREEGEDVTWRLLLQQADLEDVDVQLALWELAFNAHAQMRKAADNEATADISEATLENSLRKLAPNGSQIWVDAMIQLIKLRAGLLVEERPGVYRFPHRTFQEYLAACHLSRQPDFTEQAEALAAKGQSWWVVILLAVGQLVHVNKDLAKPFMLVGELCPSTTPPTDDDNAWRKIWLAGACLREIGLKRSQRSDRGQELLSRLQTRLSFLITHGLLEPRERAEAGSVLSELGDPRDLAEMVEVAAGEFLMGSADADISRWQQEEPDSFWREWYERERPRHSVCVPAFCIGKYPVTNGQYAGFVAATGHRPPDHWRGPQPPPELRNHPVVYVSWYDAVAFCQWLSQQQGREYRLPTEAEWEKAARGPDGRIYPWKGGFDPRKCNMDETGIGATSPAGMFPAGASPYGCLDMSGNVWEWDSVPSRVGE